MAESNIVGISIMWELHLQESEIDPLVSVYAGESPDDEPIDRVSVVLRFANAEEKNNFTSVYPTIRVPIGG